MPGVSLVLILNHVYLERKKRSKSCAHKKHWCVNWTWPMREREIIHFKEVLFTAFFPLERLLIVFAVVFLLCDEYGCDQECCWGNEMRAYRKGTQDKLTLYKKNSILNLEQWMYFGYSECSVHKWALIFTASYESSITPGLTPLCLPKDRGYHGEIWSAHCYLFPLIPLLQRPSNQQMSPAEKPKFKQCINKIRAGSFVTVRLFHFVPANSIIGPFGHNRD